MSNIAIVLGSFHKTQIEITLEEARKTASELDLTIVDETWVPGSMEKPLALKKLLLRDDIDGAVALGIIEKGETSHGFVMAQGAINAIISMQIDLLKPIGVGILGPDIQPSQIDSRLRPYGRDAVRAVAHMLKNT